MYLQVNRRVKDQFVYKRKDKWSVCKEGRIKGSLCKKDVWSVGKWKEGCMIGWYLERKMYDRLVFGKKDVWSVDKWKEGCIIGWYLEKKMYDRLVNGKKDVWSVGIWKEGCMIDW